MLDTTRIPDFIDETGGDITPHRSHPNRVEARKRSLRMRHSRINMEVMVEQQRPLPDNVQLLALKRKRLAIKDELYRLERQHSLG